MHQLCPVAAHTQSDMVKLQCYKYTCYKCECECECVSNTGLVGLQFQNNILNYSEILQVQKAFLNFEYVAGDVHRELCSAQLYIRLNYRGLVDFKAE